MTWSYWPLYYDPSPGKPGTPDSGPHPTRSPEEVWIREKLQLGDSDHIDIAVEKVLEELRGDAGSRAVASGKGEIVIRVNGHVEAQGSAAERIWHEAQRARHQRETGLTPGRLIR